MPPIIVVLIGGGLASFGAVGGYLLYGLITSSLLFSIGTSLVLGGLSQMMRKKPSFPDFKQEISVRSVTVREPLAPHRWLSGETRIGGTITFLHVSGTNGEFLHLVITLTGHTVTAINNIYFDGELVTLDGGGNGTGKWAGFVRVKKALGASGQTAHADLVSESGGKWTTNHRQRGRANIYVRLKISADLFTQLPNITADVQGRKLFDPRDSSTTFSTNWALCVRDYLVNGLGIVAAKVNDTLIIAAANLSDENVNLDPSGTEKRYTCTGTFTTDKRPWDILSALLTAGAGELAFVEGKWDLYGGAWRAPTVSLDEDDLRGPITVQSRLPRADLFNAVKGTFVSADNDWQPSDFPPLTNSTYETEDSGERIWRDIELPFTVSSPTAQRLAKLELEQARRQKTVRLPMKMAAFLIQSPDVVQFSYPKFNWTNKTFKVAKLELTSEKDAEGLSYPAVDLVLRETDASVYSWSAEEAADATPPDPVLPDPQTVAPPTGLGLGVLTEVRLDFVWTFLRAIWTAPADEAVTNGGEIEVEFKRNSSGTWLALEPIPGDATEKVWPQVAHNTAYDVRVRSVNSSGHRSVWVQQLNFTVTDVPSPSLYFPILLGNPAFEGGDALWNKGTGWTIQSDQGNAYDGNYVAKFVGSSDAALRNNVFITAVQGDRILATCMIKRTAGDAVPKIRIAWQNASKAEFAFSYGDPIVSSSYEQSRVIGEAPAGTFFARIEVVAGGPTVSSTIFVDQFFATFVSRNSDISQTLDDLGEGLLFHFREQVFVEYFDQQVHSAWNLRSGGATITYPLDGQAGGRVLQAVGASDWRAYPVNIPFDPSKLYRIRCRVRQTGNPTDPAKDGFYCGVEGIRADGVTLCNTAGDPSSGGQHYIAATNEDGGAWGLNTWVEYTGYFKGWAGTGSTKSPDPANPGALHTNVRYFRPLFIMNWIGGDGTQQLDYIAVDILPDDYGANFELVPSIATGLWDNPENAFDGDDDSFAQGVAGSFELLGYAPILTDPYNVKVKMVSSGPTNPAGATIFGEYSKDSGANWINIYTRTSTFGKTIDEVTIPTPPTKCSKIKQRQRLTGGSSGNQTKNGGTFSGSENYPAGTVNWSNPSSVQTSDNAYATASLGSEGVSNYLLVTNLGFSISGPVQGIRVRIERKGSAANVIEDASVNLWKNGAKYAGGKAAAGFWPNTDAYVSYGDSTDLWFGSFSEAEINANDFGVGIAVRNDDISSHNALIDHIEITVWWSGLMPTGRMHEATVVISLK